MMTTARMRCVAPWWVSPNARNHPTGVTHLERRTPTMFCVQVYIRLSDALGPTMAGAFDDFTVRTETILTGDVPDDAALHGLIARCRDLGISMLDLRVEGRDDSSETHRGPSGPRVRPSEPVRSSTEGSR